MAKENIPRLKFKPALGLFDAAAINIGAIIGAGIFVVTGIAAGLAGSAVILSIILASIVALFTALSFAELTTWLQREGSIYIFASKLLSPLAGFLAGWMWLLSNALTGAAVSLGFAHYLEAIFPGVSVNLMAASLCLAFTAINFLGVRESALFNDFLVLAKLLVLLFFVIFGLMYFNPENFLPFSPLKTGVLFGAFYIFFAFGGFARVAVLAEEVKEAKKNVPRAIVLSVLISTLLYVLVGIAALGLTGAQRLAVSRSPLTEAIRATGNSLSAYIISAGGLLATASVLLTSILGVSRMAYAMARRTDLPRVFARLHPKFNTPYYSVWIVGFFMVAFVLFIDISKVLAISTFALLFYYALANLSALKLKNEERLYPRIVPILGLFTCLALLFFILFHSPQVCAAGVGGLIIGAAYYLAKNKIVRKKA